MHIQDIFFSPESGPTGLVSYLFSADSFQTEIKIFYTAVNAFALLVSLSLYCCILGGCVEVPSLLWSLCSYLSLYSVGENWTLFCQQVGICKSNSQDEGLATDLPWSSAAGLLMFPNSFFRVADLGGSGWAACDFVQPLFDCRMVEVGSDIWGVIWSYPAAQGGLPRTGCPGSCPYGFLISPRTDFVKYLP